MIGRFPWDPFPSGAPDPKGPDPLQALVYRAGVSGADAYRSVRMALKRENGVLRVGNRFVADGRYREVAFVSVGHAANSMALGALAVLDERVTQGYLAGPDDVSPDVPFRGVRVAPGWGASEDAAGIGQAIREIAERLGESDLLLLLLSPGAGRAVLSPPPGMTAGELGRFLEDAHARGASGREVGLLARVLGEAPADRAMLPAQLRADVETLVVERGDGAAFVGGGPTIRIRAGERSEARAVLERIGLGAAVPVGAAERLRPGAESPASPRSVRRPVVVAGPPDALRSAADTTFEKGWTARLAALSLRESPAEAADRFLDLTETLVRTDMGVVGRGSKGLAALAMLTLDRPDGTDEGPALLEFLDRAQAGLRRREMSVGLFRTGGTIGDGAYPPGAVVGAPSDPGSTADRTGVRAVRMPSGITDVGLLAAAVVPRPASGG